MQWKKISSHPGFRRLLFFVLVLLLLLFNLGFLHWQRRLCRHRPRALSAWFSNSSSSSFWFSSCMRQGQGKGCKGRKG